MKCFRKFSIILIIKDAQDIELYQARLFFEISMIALCDIIIVRLHLSKIRSVNMTGGLALPNGSRQWAGNNAIEG